MLSVVELWPSSALLATWALTTTCASLLAGAKRFPAEREAPSKATHHAVKRAATHTPALNIDRPHALRPCSIAGCRNEVSCWQNGELKCAPLVETYKQTFKALREVGCVHSKEERRWPKSICAQHRYAHVGPAGLTAAL